MKILVVDDSKDDRILLDAILKSEGYNDLIFATSAHEAFKILHLDEGAISQCPVDLILMDVSMPEMDGICACQKIKAYPKMSGIPVIMVTGKDDGKNLGAAFEAGAVDYITKPIKKVELLARVSSILRLKFEMDARKEKEKELLQKNHELEHALGEIKLLRGFIPICASCKKIRDDKGYWSQVESYISKHSGAKFTHGICPDCMDKLYPGMRK